MAGDSSPPPPQADAAANDHGAVGRDGQPDWGQRPDIPLLGDLAAPPDRSLDTTAHDTLTHDTLTHDTLAPINFGDVPTGHPQYQEIQWVAQQSIMIGCQATPPLFCPDAAIKRSEVAVTLVRMKHGDSFSYSSTPHFNDVPATHWAFKYVQKLYEDGVTSGYGDGSFKPDQGATRAEGATFLMHMKHGDSFSYSSTPYANDVPATHWAFKYVQKLYADGVTSGCGAGNYCPADPMLRKHWAVFLYRVKTL
ncbi:MAG: S-layer homology domain-containing protein [Bacteroidales bacterium]